MQQKICIRLHGAVMDITAKNRLALTLKHFIKDFLSKEGCDVIVTSVELSEDEELVKATFVSVWAGGITVKTPCLYNPAISDVTEVQPVDIQGLNVLDREYLELPDGTQIEREDFTIDGDCDEG